MKILLYACLLLTLCSSSCKKENNNEDQLPPATQTEANTFGCKINGKIYVPKGYNGDGTPNPNITADIGLNGLPVFGIDARRLATNNQFEGQLIVAFQNITYERAHNYPIDFNFSASWINIGNCGTIDFDTSTQKWGGDYHKI